MSRALSGSRISGAPSAGKSRRPSKPVARASEPSVDEEADQQPDSYWSRSEGPLTTIAFLLPLLLIYQWGQREYGQGPIIAFSLLQKFCALLHLKDPFAPIIAVLIPLSTTHVLKRDRWRVVIGDLPRMAIESVVLAVPLLVLWYAISPFLLRWTTCSAPPVAAAVPCIGAGIYEEFVFRLLMLNLLSFALIDVLKLRKLPTHLLMVLISAVLFSAYHYLGSEQFFTPTFIFRFVAGLYFAAIFLCRGYGVTCGAHASYDMMIVLLQFAR